MKLDWWNVSGRQRKRRKLKTDISHRLNVEDYTCRLPDRGKPYKYKYKPRIRYRLTKKFLRPKGQLRITLVYA